MLEEQRKHSNWFSDSHPMNQIQELLLMVRRFSHYGRLKIMIMNSLPTLLKRKINSVTSQKQSQSIKNHNNCGHMLISDTIMEILNIILNGQIAHQPRNSQDGMLLPNIGHYILDKIKNIHSMERQLIQQLDLVKVHLVLPQNLMITRLVKLNYGQVFN